MLTLFKKNKPGISISCTADELLINGTKIELPVDWQELEALLGPATKKSRSEVAWKELGISTSPHANGRTDHLTLHTGYNGMAAGSAAEQKPFFDGKIIVDGREIDHSSFDKAVNRKYEISSFVCQGQPCLISIQYNSAFDSHLEENQVPEDKYTILPLDEAIIPFADLNFKLCIIQILMYEMELLSPIFDLHEFIGWYQQRDIDTEEERFEPIPEVMEYFRQLPIPQRLADKITEIYQDGGNDIYLNTCLECAGYEDFWDIASAEDARHFPNLRKATLCYAKEEVLGELQAMGIDARWL